MARKENRQKCRNGVSDSGSGLLNENENKSLNNPHKSEGKKKSKHKSRRSLKKDKEGTVSLLIAEETRPESSDAGTFQSHKSRGVDPESRDGVETSPHTSNHSDNSDGCFGHLGTGLDGDNTLENFEVSIMVVFSNLMTLALSVSKISIQWLVRWKPLLDPLKSNLLVATGYVLEKVQQAYPTVVRWLMHFGNIMLLLSMVWLNYALRGMESFLCMGMTSILSVICDILIFFLRNNINKQSRADSFPDQTAGVQGAPSFYSSGSVPSSTDDGYVYPVDRGTDIPSNSGSDAEMTSEDEVLRLLNSTDHYSALGLMQFQSMDASVLKREYGKKAMLVHPDKNMGNKKAAEAFKKLQNAYEVLLDTLKRKAYDDELRREELLNYLCRFQSPSQKILHHSLVSCHIFFTVFLFFEPGFATLEPKVFQKQPRYLPEVVIRSAYTLSSPDLTLSLVGFYWGGGYGFFTSGFTQTEAAGEDSLRETFDELLAKSVETFMSGLSLRKESPKQDGASPGLKVHVKRTFDNTAFSSLALVLVRIFIFFHSQECKDYHPVKDGDGWVEQPSHPFFFGMLLKVDNPVAYVCADSRIYNATEWYICQFQNGRVPPRSFKGMRCPINSHKPSFHVNTSVTLKNSYGKRSSSGQKGRMPMPNMEENMTEEEFVEWLQNAVQAGMFDDFDGSIPQSPFAPARSTSKSTTSNGSGSGNKRKKKGKKQW
ncbi:hypothetical protein BC332_02051 [Capsicum chinense]|nr:hypothetical protein BC332_02051 [Capsicum chinense]